MRKTYNEDKKLLHNFLEKTFFTTWQKGDDGNFSSLELQVSASCDKGCVYCYYHNYGEHLYPSKLNNRKNILKNTDIILEWLERKKMFPQIELFSGEIFSQKVGFEVTEKVIDFYIRNNVKTGMCIPTNFSFIDDGLKTSEVTRLIEKGWKNGVNVVLSCSIDGKYMDYKNRPHKNNQNFYSDEYYDKVFEFARIYKSGFHPMIYYKNIKKWIDNFLWFQEMFKKHHIPWNNIYLLEVRNDGWNKESINEYQKFIKFVYSWVFENKFNSNKKDFIENFILSNKNMNIFNNFCRSGRGLGCSAQSSLYVRLGDLTCNPCHRTSYDFFNTLYFKCENEKIVDIEPLNVNLFISWISMDKNNFPYCQDCLIRDFCAGGCLGSQFESTSEIFLPIQSVCWQQHGKFKAQVDWLLENNMFWDIAEKILFKKNTMIRFKELLYGI